MSGNQSSRGITIANGGLQFNANLASWSIGNVGDCRIIDYFNVAPTGSLSDPQLRLATHLATCVWGQQGHLWLQQTLTAGATFHVLNSGAQGSLQLNNNLYWQPVKELRINFSLTFNGTFDSNTGWGGDVSFGGNMKMIDTKAAFAGVGLSF